MARGKGFQSIVGFKGGGSTWGTAVECAALSGFYANDFKVSGGVDVIPDNRIHGGYVAKIATPGAHKAQVMFNADLAYSGFERCVANFFGGVSGTPATVDTSAYQHVHKFADRDAIFGTFAYESVKDTTITEAPSVQFSKLSLSGKSQGVFTISMEGMGDAVEIASSVNTTTTIDTVTVPTGGLYTVPFSQASFLLNNQTAGSLASAPIYVSGIDVSIERPIDANVTTERGNKSSLFKPTGMASGKLTIEFSVAQNGTGGNIALLTDRLASTAQKAKLVMTSSVLAGASTQYFQHVLWFPNLRALPGDVLPVTNAGVVSWSQEYEIANIGSAPIGFTSGYADGVVWEMFSQLSTNALA